MGDRPLVEGARSEGGRVGCTRGSAGRPRRRGSSIGSIKGFDIVDGVDAIDIFDNVFSIDNVDSIDLFVPRKRIFESVGASVGESVGATVGCWAGTSV